MRVIFFLGAAFIVAIINLSFAPLAPEARAWGKYGHLTVCDLAYRNLTPTARVALNDLLQSRRGGIRVKGRGRMPDRTYTSFNIGCLEEDAIPRRNPDDHFINVARSVTAIDSASCPTGTSCILAGIQRDFETLRDTARPREERVFALMALGHWIGDIHQPLHVSFADDRGGNRIDATLTGRCGSSRYRVQNLHGVWDNCLLEAGLFERVRQRADYRRNWGANTITYRAVDTLQANTSLADERTIAGGDPSQWAQESYRITLDPDVLYCNRSAGQCRYSAATATWTGAQQRTVAIDQAYLARFAPLAQERIRRAGFRLAHLINQALDPAYTQPVANSTQQSS